MGRSGPGRCRSRARGRCRRRCGGRASAAARRRYCSPGGEAQPGHGLIQTIAPGSEPDPSARPRAPWAERAHPGQREPAGDHDTWLILAGRGFGKTQAGAEWVAEAVLGGRDLRIALVSATVEEARDVMVQGASGLLALRPEVVERWLPSRGEIHFVNGCIGKLFSGANPERLRGFQHHLAWCDELAKWKKGSDSWDNLQFGLRLGDHPKALVTTTPAASPALEAILADPTTVTTGGTTFDNPHLPDRFKARMRARYDGTHKGEVELYGRMPPPAGALWGPDLIAASRAAAEAFVPPLAAIAVGVDPPARDGTCGIVACGRDFSGNYHVMTDHSIAASSPTVWSGRVADVARQLQSEQDDGRSVFIVAEDNQGGYMVRDVILKHQGDDLQVGLVHASVSKAARAEPIALLFERGKVTLHGRFPEMERQMCGLIAGGGYEGPGTSPDRADAMVWALTKLSEGRQRAEPSIRSLLPPQFE